MILHYTLIRSKRRSLSLQISKEGVLIARAPMKMSVNMIEGFIEEKRGWIEKNQRKMEEKWPRKIYTEKEIKILKDSLKGYIVPRVQKLWEWKNLPKFTSIKITKSERRWWSCSSRNGLCFSYRLAESLSSQREFIDAIIFHELAHLREKNHQKPFWNLVYTMMPEYEEVMKRTQNTSAD